MIVNARMFLLWIQSGAASPRASTGYTPSFPVVHGAGQPGGRIEFGNMARLPREERIFETNHAVLVVNLGTCFGVMESRQLLQVR